MSCMVVKAMTGWLVKLVAMFCMAALAMTRCSVMILLPCPKDSPAAMTSSTPVVVLTNYTAAQAMICWMPVKKMAKKISSLATMVTTS